MFVVRFKEDEKSFKVIGNVIFVHVKQQNV